MKRVLKVGIMPRNQFREYAIAIAKGERRPRPDEPKIWFESIRSLAEVLSDENRQLLTLIAETKPKSLKELETVSGRHASNLSRTLKTMEKYGIVELKHSEKTKTVRPVVKATRFQVDLPLEALA